MDLIRELPSKRKGVCATNIIMIPTDKALDIVT
jgi:hypothetical protein